MSPRPRPFLMPQELVLQIAECIPAINDLSAFVRTCRKTYQAANDILYRAAVDSQWQRSEQTFRLTNNINTFPKRAANSGNTIALARMFELCPAGDVPAGK